MKLYITTDPLDLCSSVSMRLITVLLVLIALLSVGSQKITKQHAVALRTVCVDMVKRIFPDNYCLYYITDTAVAEVPFVSYCLKNLNSSLVLVNPESGTSPSLPIAKQIPCDGYLIVSSNYTALNRFFTYRYERSFEFQTHKRILILYVGKGNFMVAPFSTVANLKGNDIVVVDKLPNYERDLDMYIVFYRDGQYVREDDIIDENVTIRVSSVRENKILKEWRYLIEDLDKSLIKFTHWKPNFQRENDTFKVACYDCPPYVYVDQENKVYDGIDYEIIKLIANEWPITFEVDNFSIYRDMYANTLKRIRDGRNDLGACSIWTRATSSSQMDRSISYSDTCLSFLVPKPHILKPMWLVFYPISAFVWILTAVVTIIVAVLIKLAPKSDERHYNNLDYTLLQSLRVLALGPLNRFPIKSHFVFKMVLMIWLYTCLILTTGYSAGFSSALTYPTYSEDIKTIKDMVKQDIHWGSTTTGLRDNLIHSGDPGVAKLINNFLLEKDINVKNERIRSNKYAVNVNMVASKYVSDTRFLDDYAKKNLKVLQECFSTNSIVYALKTNSPYKGTLNRRLLRLIEHGLVEFWTNRILNKYKLLNSQQYYTKLNDIANAYEPLNLAKLRGIFYFLIIGYCAAIIAFIGEYWYDLYSKNTFVLYSTRLRVKK
ncbi:hypothetical protein Trydic_g12096 [Trypoxylus dichotomus]